MAGEPNDKASEPDETPKPADVHDENLLDEALEESFPASDPPSVFNPS